MDLDIESLQKMARDFVEGFSSGDVDLIMKGYGARYVDVNLRNPVQSHEERRAYYGQAMRRLAGVRLEVHPDEIVVEGSLAWIRGRINLIPREEPNSAPTELRYIEIARKGPDGWKVVWGMDGPVQEYEPPS